MKVTAKIHSYLEPELCSGHRNSEGKCKNGRGQSVALGLETWPTSTVVFDWNFTGRTLWTNM